MNTATAKPGILSCASATGKAYQELASQDMDESMEVKTARQDKIGILSEVVVSLGSVVSKDFCNTQCIGAANCPAQVGGSSLSLGYNRTLNQIGKPAQRKKLKEADQLLTVGLDAETVS